MKRLLLILILTFIFQPWTRADDVRDLEIEGISIGDSLLDHYSLKEIQNAENNPTYYPKSNKFKIIFFNSKLKELYEMISFEIKTNDKRYIIYGIKGDKAMSEKECLKKKRIVVNQIKSVIPNNTFEEYTSYYSKSYGNSKAIVSHFNTNNGGMIRAWCTVWDKNNKIVKDNLWRDSLDIGFSNKELRYFIDNEAY